MSRRSRLSYHIPTVQWGAAYENKSNAVSLPITATILVLVATHISDTYTQGLAFDSGNLKILSTSTNSAVAGYIAITK